MTAPRKYLSATAYQFYDGCDVTKNCFGTPDGCVPKQDCSAVMAVQLEDSNYVFEMQVKNAAYVAVGLSSDDKMVSLLYVPSMAYLHHVHSLRS